MYIDLHHSNSRAELKFGRSGRRSIFFESSLTLKNPRETHDYAAFSALLIALHFGRSVSVSATISEQAYENIRELLAGFRAWGLTQLSDSDIEFTKVVKTQNHVKKRAYGVCISSGIDSSYLLTRNEIVEQVTHGLVVHGADFLLKQDEGFEKLKLRVDKICDLFNIIPVIVKTNLRSIRYNWNLFHMIQLAACIHYIGPEFSEFIVAADNTPDQDLLRFPWGNCGMIGRRLSGQLKVNYLGHDVDRIQKIAAIANYPDLSKEIGVCFSNQRFGGNCGVCGKCLMTRLAFESVSKNCLPRFAQMPEPASAIQQIVAPNSPLVARGNVVRISELLPHVRDTATRAALNDLLSRSRTNSRYGF